MMCPIMENILLNLFNRCIIVTKQCILCIYIGVQNHTPNPTNVKALKTMFDPHIDIDITGLIGSKPIKLKLKCVKMTCDFDISSGLQVL